MRLESGGGQSEATVREVRRGQIMQGLRGHRKEVSFIQSAAGGQ